MLFIYFLFVFFLVLFLFFFGFFIYEKSFNFESVSSFECGFDSVGGSRVSFSLHFFLILLIFLIFDVEVVYVLPYFLGVYYLGVYCDVFFFFVLFLFFFGLLHEFFFGSLDWV
uniref:NADH-ubiquinone oxidoreductase chain 3 n=1 Tax=Sinentomon erythranum TaxID=289455 RepID=G3D5N4_9HEXA|nr:NADH dehydrogenase subunit 3 [Sinentomon erythranum]ADN32961.1 NADH dehydrogenase subunit 3 [Sinentomon erythranum]